MIETAADFLLAIKESTGTAFDEGAVEFLSLLQRNEAEAAKLAGATGEKLGRILFFNGMLRGVQLKLARVRIDAQIEANEAGFDVRTGTPITKITTSEH
jgi:hypothetical protein